MSRLPTPGSDDNTWGDLLNDFLQIEHNGDGTLKRAAQINNTEQTANNAYKKPGGGIPKSDLAALNISDGDVSGISESKITNLPTDLAAKVDKSTLTTKGDIFVATAASTITRLPAGANGRFLQADSTQAAGLGWVTATDALHVSGLAGDGVTDDGPAIQAVLDTLGISGSHSSEVLVESPPTGVIYINSTVQIESDNVTLRFGSPVLYGPLGRIRIQGELAETPASNKPVLTAGASAGATTITVNDASPFSAGSYIVIRGGRDATGNTMDNQKEYHTVLSVGGTTLTLNEPLENSYLTFNPNPGTPPSFSHATEVTRAITNGITSAANRGDRTVTVSDTSIFAAGDYVQLLDDSHTIDPTGADETTNYKHHEAAEVKQIISATQLRLSHALYHTYNLAKNARVAKMNPVKHAVIRDANVTWSAMSIVSNAFEIRNGVQCMIYNCQVAGDGAKTKSWRNQAFRQTDSYMCEVSSCYATDPANTDSGKGYGATFYGATHCMLTNSRFSSNRHSVLFFTGAAGNIVSSCVSEDVCLSDYDFHGAECVDNLITDCTAIGGDSLATDGSVNKSACKIGNTSHTDGDFHNVFTNMLIVNYQGAAFEVIPSSGDNTFRDSRVTGALTGIKLVSNAGNAALVSSNTFIENVDFADITTALTNINGSGTAMVQGLVIENCRFIRSTTGLNPQNAQKVRIRRNSFYDPNLASLAYGISGNNITSFSVKSNDLSGCQRGVKLTTCPNARITYNVMHDLIDTTVYEDAGGNGGTLFAHNDIYGFAPFFRTSGSGPSGSGVVDIYPVYQSNHPTRHGFIEWNFDPTYASATGTGQIATSSSLFLMKITGQTGGAVSNIIVTLGTIGSGFTAGQSFAGIYDDTGTRIAATADQAATWGGSTGVKTMALTASATLQAGRDYFVALVANATTPPQFVTASANNSTSTPNANLSNAAQRFSVNGTSVTALPASVTLSSNSGSGTRSFWVGLS